MQDEMRQHHGIRSWLEQRQDLFAKNVVRDFIRAQGFLSDLEHQDDNGGISYEELAAWVGTQSDRGALWVLKDNCHRLWRDVGPGINPEAFFFDWLVGAIFHEAMKLKENVYLVDQYQPAYQRAMIPTKDERHSTNFAQFFEQTKLDIDKGLHRLAYLFRHAAEQLRELLLQERGNTLLLRYLLEERAEIDRLWRKSGGLEPVLLRLFPLGMDQAYCVAGESYLEGNWYTKARLAFEEALRINPGSQDARSGLRVLGKRLKDETLSFRRESYVFTDAHGESPLSAAQ